MSPSTATSEKDGEKFRRLVSGDGIVHIEFCASWCGACSSLATAYEQVARRHRNYTFAKLDAETRRDLVASLGVTHLPSLLLYRDGILLFQQAEVFDEEALEDIVLQVAGGIRRYDSDPRGAGGRDDLVLRARRGASPERVVSDHGVSLLSMRHGAARTTWTPNTKGERR